jgi:hypothetical protein
MTSLIYRCQQCGTVFYRPQHSAGTPAEILNGRMYRFETSRTTHECTEQCAGVADLIGAVEGKVEP